MVAAPQSRRSSRSKQISTAVNGKLAPASKSAAAPVSKKRRASEDEQEKPRSKRAKNGAAEVATKLMKVAAPEKKNAVADKKSAAAPKKPAAPRAARAFINNIPDLSSSVEDGNPNQMFVWGAGNFGQFGMGPDIQDEFDKPKKNTWIEKKTAEGVFGKDGAGIAAIAAGGMHTMFIDSNGSVWTCGVNDEGALGRATDNVPDPEKEGEFLDADDLLPTPYPLQTLIDENFKAVSIAAGDSISAAVSADGELRVWGSFRASEGALGFSGGSKKQILPVPILTLSPKDGEKVASVAAGTNHLVVLTTHGHIYTWGAGEQGQLGRKIMERHKIHGTNPERVTLRTRTLKAKVIGAGSYHSFAVDNKGDVWGWGLNNMGQTGTGFNEADTTVLLPTKIPELCKDVLGGATVVKISGGEHHSLFLTSDGRVFACGRANCGQLGLPADHPALKEPEEQEGLVATPTLISFPDNDDPIVHISAGLHNNLGVAASGALYSWGQGNQGELGVGDDSDQPTPKAIVRREGGAWKAVSAACGGQHSLALLRKKVAD